MNKKAHNPPHFAHNPISKATAGEGMMEYNDASSVSSESLMEMIEALIVSERLSEEEKIELLRSLVAIVQEE